MTAKWRWIALSLLVAIIVTGVVVYQILEQRRIQHLLDTLGGDDEIAVIDAQNEFILSKSSAVTERLIDALAAEKRKERDRVIAILTEKGAPAVEPLIKRLETRQPARQPVQQTRPRLFGSWFASLPGAVPPAAWTAADRFEETRAGAATALGRIGDRRAVEALVAALKDEDWGVVEEAAKALDAIGDASALPALATLAAADKTGNIAYNVLEIIGHFKEKGAPYVVAFLRAEDENTGNAAIIILRQYGASEADKIAPMMKDANPAVRARAVQVLGALGNAGAVAAALQDSSQEVRATAAAVFAHAPAAKDEAAAATASLASTASVLEGAEVASQDSDTLLRLLDDKNAEMRMYAVLGLGRRREARAAPRLMAALKDTSATVRQAAIRGLGAIGDKQAAEPLFEIMDRDSNDLLRNLAAVSLAQLGDPRARRVPFQDIVPSQPAEAVTAEAWNEEATSSILDQTLFEELRDDRPELPAEEIVWPSPESIKRLSGEPDAEVKASAVKWIRKFVRPEYLPDGIETHLISMRNIQLIPNYGDAALMGSVMEADSGKNMTENLQHRIWCTVNLVRFKKGDYVIQIMETPYNVVVAVGSEKAAAGQNQVTFVAEVAKAVLREQMSMAADDVFSEDFLISGIDGESIVCSGREGEMLTGMRMNPMLKVSFDRKEDTKLRLNRLYTAAIGTTGIDVESDGRFVRFDMEKADLRGMGYFECKEFEEEPLETLPLLEP